MARDAQMTWLMRILPDSVRIGANKAIMIRGGIGRFANWQCQGWRNTQMIPVGGYACDITAGAIYRRITAQRLLSGWILVSPAGFEPATY